MQVSSCLYIDRYKLTLRKFPNYNHTNMASSKSDRVTYNEEENTMIPENVVLCWRCICMKRCKKHKTSNVHRNTCLVTAIVLGIIFLGALVFSIYCVVFVSMLINVKNTGRVGPITVVKPRHLLLKRLQQAKRRERSCICVLRSSILLLYYDFSIGFQKCSDSFVVHFMIYSQTCIKRSPLGKGETGLISQVTS